MNNDHSQEDILLGKAKQYAHAVYKLSKHFPKEEQFGLTSQLRRAATSVPINIVEGYARQSRKTQINFLTIAYGSLKESQFILDFAYEEKYVSHDAKQEAFLLGEEVARMLWTKIKTLRNNAV